MRWRRPGEAVKVAVRPENVQLGGSGEANRLLARITGQRYQGTQTIYELAVLVCRLLSVWPNNDSTARQETAALRDINPAYVGSGSKPGNPRTVRIMSALPRPPEILTI
jgi:TOBE domain